MNNDNQIWHLAEAYHKKELSGEALISLQERLVQDDRFRNEFEEAVNVISSLQQKGEQLRFKNTLKDIHSGLHTKPVQRQISLRSHYVRTGAVAASVALLTSLGISWLHNRHQDPTPRYSELRKVKSELEGIKKSQSKIIRDLDNKAQKPLTENKYSGTGFALTNDGYLVTNYHVTEGADSVYIQTRNGEYFKASTISFDVKSDIAILKVESRKFRFSKQQTSLPYTFATAKKTLGERVFTLGYPQDEIVYSEGYISSRNGFLGDSMQYRLELPAEPGQSGAPVLDASGNVVAIVTGKESQSVNITYAVSSNTLLRMLHSIPQSNAISLPKSGKLSGMSREKQIERLQDYTCVVNVYK